MDSTVTQNIYLWLTTLEAAYGLRIINAVIILIVGTVVIRLFARVLRKVLHKVGKGSDMAMRFIASVIVKAAWACLSIVILEHLGINVGPLIAGLGVTGFVLGFAFQESLGSLASGLMLAINQPFKVGDYVVVGGNEGKVLALDMMAVTLATADNRRITIPNKIAWGAPIVNFSALELRRVDLMVGVAYGSDLTKAKDVAGNAMSKIPGVLADPALLVEVKSLDASAVTLTIRAWVNNADYWKVYFAGNKAIVEALASAGIEIPFNQLDVNIRS